MLQTTKKTFRLPEILLVAGLCFIMLLHHACNTRMEGCLDVAALNFDLDADRLCDGCCRYPPILLSLSQKWDQENFNTDDTLYDADLRPYKIIDLKFALTSFAWRDVNGSVYTIDSSSIQCENAIVNYTKDILIIDSRRFQYTLDSIRLFPSIHHLNFKLGWVDALNCVDPYEEEPTSVFADENPLWDSLSNSRAAVRLILRRDLNSDALDTVYINTCQSIDIPYVHSFVTGMPTQLDLSVNYAQWFRDASIWDLNTFAVSLLANLEGSINRTL